MALYWDEKASSSNGKHYYLGIGIDQYRHIQGPNNCKTDVRRLHDYLLSRYQFEQAQCTMLLDEAATKDRILAELQRMGQLLQEADSLFIFFAGHGSMMDGDTEGYIIPYDGEFEQQPSKEDWVLSTPSLVVPILNIKARHLLIVIDSGIRPYHFSLAAKGFQPEIEIDSRGLEGNLEQTVSRWTVDATGIENADGGIFLHNFLHVLEQDPHPRIGIGTIMAQIRRREDAQKSRLSLYGPVPELGDEGGEYHFYLKEELVQQNEALTQAWRSVTETDTQAAYEQFIQQYPHTHLSQLATEKLRQLEFMAWGEAIEADQRASYEAYLAAYPNGIFTQKAQERLQTLTEKTPQSGQLNALEVERALFAFNASRNKQELETFITLYPKQLVLVQQAREAMKRMEFDVDLAFIQACRTKIAQAQLDAVMFELSKINTDPLIRDEISFHSSTWTMLNRDQRKGILKREDYQHGVATLTNKIHMLLIELEKPLLRK